MGYMTSFELKYYLPVTHKDVASLTEDAILLYMEEKGDYFKEFEQGYMQGKWYDHDKDMIEMSKEFPEVVFELYGVGEEQPDMWKSWYYNGQSHDTAAEITFGQCPW